jgi:eukaryotic-like serine/threonine-protein kinase
MADAGSLVASRYWLERRIVAGGTVEAWRAADLTTGRPVAVRLLRTACAACVERFLAAAEHAAQVCHPGIARIHDYGQADSPGSPFLVTELVGASSLAAVMQAGPLEPAWVLELICQVTSALGAAHSAGLMHQDINPGNLLLAPGGAVKLTGFGLAQGAGSPGSDLYSLGLVAWGCLTGSLPASGASLEVAPGQESRPLLPAMPATVPAGIAGLAADLLATGPAARPASVAEVVTRCRELMAVPMRVAEPRQANCSPTTLLLDPPAQGSRKLARIA